MSDTQFAAYKAKCATAARLSAEILPHNKQVLFDALTAADIDIVTIGFDGSGDSGQFDAPAGFDAENREVAIPTGGNRRPNDPLAGTTEDMRNPDDMRQSLDRASSAPVPVRRQG